MDAIIILGTVAAMVYLFAGSIYVILDATMFPCRCGYEIIHKGKPCVKTGAERHPLKTHGDLVLFLVRALHPVTYIMRWWMRPLHDQPVPLASPQPNEELWKLPR